MKFLAFLFGICITRGVLSLYCESSQKKTVSGLIEESQISYIHCPNSECYSLDIFGLGSSRGCLGHITDFFDINVNIYNEPLSKLCHGKESTLKYRGKEYRYTAKCCSNKDACNSDKPQKMNENWLICNSCLKFKLKNGTYELPVSHAYCPSSTCFSGTFLAVIDFETNDFTQYQQSGCYSDYFLAVSDIDWCKYSYYPFSNMKCCENNFCNNEQCNDEGNVSPPLNISSNVRVDTYLHIFFLIILTVFLHN